MIQRFSYHIKLQCEQAKYIHIFSNASFLYRTFQIQKKQQTEGEKERDIQRSLVINLLIRIQNKHNHMNQWLFGRITNKKQLKLHC